MYPQLCGAGGTAFEGASLVRNQPGTHLALSCPGSDPERTRPLIANGWHDDKIKVKCLRSGSSLMRTGSPGHLLRSSCAFSLDGKPEQ